MRRYVSIVDKLAKIIYISIISGYVLPQTPSWAMNLGAVSVILICMVIGYRMSDDVIEILDSREKNATAHEP